MATEIELYYDKGTLVLHNFPENLASELSQIKWDKRTLVYRSPAIWYRDIVLKLREKNIPYKDKARQFQIHQFNIKKHIEPRDFQAEAKDAWKKAGSRGVVTLPTGAGKTILAVMLISETQRPSLVHVPTIDLMFQWQEVLVQHFDTPIGLLGGGYHEITPLTVATYDSALLHVAQRGNQFGFIIFDECHHLPGEQYQYLALSSIAPFRLGLTATPDRQDGRDSWLYYLCGNLCYETHIDELEGETLAPYEIITLEVEMESDEQEQYDLSRKQYLDFIKRENIDFGHPGGWKTFLWRASLNPEGRQAFQAYLRQKQLSQASSAKEKLIWDLIVKHREDQVLVFTQDNEMAYRLGCRFLLPVLTHHTKIKERESFLTAFREGLYPVLITSKVLNEGVDVPEANVAIIVSGSGSIREHVQRLGRILRGRPGKKAYLYELVSHGTGEYFVSKRRRQHRAYQRFT